jgi:hypothetical protein
MFTGSSITSFKSDKKKIQVFSIIQDSLSGFLGDVEITEKGQIIVNTHKFEGFSHTTTIEGFVREKEGRYTVEINYETNANVVFWVILVGGLFFMFIGVLVFLFPFLAKNDIKAKADKALESLKYEFN